MSVKIFHLLSAPMRCWTLALLLGSSVTPAVWAEPARSNAASSLPQFADPRDEVRYRALIDEFRCPKCQNNNLSGSDAPIAQDLRQKTAAMIQDGQSDTQIREYMVERYGDFITYRPPLRRSTWVLWGLPPLLLVGLLLGWAWRLGRRRSEAAALSSAPATLTQAEQARLAQVLRTPSTPQEEQRP